MRLQRSRALTAGLAAIVLLAACADDDKSKEAGAGSTAARQSQPEATGRIVFDADWDIYVVDADGSRLKRLTTSPAREFDPSWSPDGRKIAYRHEPSEDGAQAEIYVMNADGTGKRNLTQSPGQDHSPAWSPDGTKIAFASTRGRDDLLPYIWTMDADGSNPTRVSSISGEYPAWSPDGAQIAFDVNTDVDPNVASGRPAGFDIFVVNADGSGLRRLTNTPGEDHGPSWSPDGMSIVFGSDRGGIELPRLWIMNADGSEERPLTDHPGSRPTWLHDGSRILFSANGLFAVRPDGSGLTKLPVRSPGELGFADWTG